MDIPVETVEQVISLSNASRLAYNKYMDKYHPDGSISLLDRENEDSPEWIAYDTCDQELMNFILGLDYGYILDLEALMAIGRENSNDFDTYRKHFASIYSSPDSKSDAAFYLASKTPLGDYLSRGLTLI